MYNRARTSKHAHTHSCSLVSTCSRNHGATNVCFAHSKIAKLLRHIKHFNHSALRKNVLRHCSRGPLVYSRQILLQDNTKSKGNAVWMSDTRAGVTGREAEGSFLASPSKTTSEAFLICLFLCTSEEFLICLFLCTAQIRSCLREVSLTFLSTLAVSFLFSY